MELFFDLAYIFIFLRLSGILVTAESLEVVAQAAVMLLVGWWVWVLTAGSIRVFFWLGVSGAGWLAGAFTGGLARVLLWVLAVAIDSAS